MTSKNKIIFVPILASLWLGSCATPQSCPPNTQDKFSQINIGSSRSDVEGIYGKTKTTLAKDGQFELKIMNYPGEVTAQDVYFTLDEGGETIAGKAKVFEFKRNRTTEEALLNSILGAADFKQFRPCHMHSNGEKYLIDQKKGFYVAADDSDSIIVAWESQELIAKQINYLFEKCPRLQPDR